MSFTRRTFLIGAGTGVSVLVLRACVGPASPSPTPPLPPSDVVPLPAQLWRSNWGTDPFSRGAISYIPVGSDPGDRSSLRLPLRDRVFFAGEATSQDPGTVSGAVRSGAVAAREVLDVVGPRELVAIVGAGAAGAEAARLLSGSDIDVIVVEARDRVGGRIDSRVDDDGAAFELGAWKLREGDERLIADVETLPLDGSLVVPSEDGLATASVTELGDVQQDVSAQLAGWASEQTTTDIGLASSVPDSGASDAAGVVGDLSADVMQSLYLEAARLAAGAEPTDVSTWFPPDTIGVASAIPTAPLSSVITSRLEGVSLALSTAVVAVAYDDDAVSLRLGTGESRRVDRVILTVPLGVLKAGSIEFDPPLPVSMRSAINSVGVGQLELVRVAFEEAFWTTDAMVWNLGESDAEITTWINLQPVTGETTLLGLAAGDSAASLLEIGDEELIRKVREQLAPFAA